MSDTPAEFLRSLASAGSATCTTMPDGSPQRIACAGAVGLVRLLADLLDQGHGVDELISRLHAAPDLRQTIRDDRAREDETIRSKPSRSEPPPGSGR